MIQELPGDPSDEQSFLTTTSVGYASIVISDAI